MGRQKGHLGPVKPDDEKQQEIIRFGMTRGDKELLDGRIKKLNHGATKKVTVASYFRTLMAGDLAKNADD